MQQAPARYVARLKPNIPQPDVPEILGLIEKSLLSGSLTMGPLVREFEAAWAQVCGVRHAVAVNSGTAALEIALRGIGVAGREVIVPTETFVASANAVILAGGRPVFAEISAETLCLDVADVARRVNERTTAVMFVHLGGLVPPDILELADFCRSRNIALIEDAAHAHGAAYQGQKAGSFGRAGCFSFYATKILTTGEGGMLTTDDDALADMARSLRHHGANLGQSDYGRVSTNWRLSELQAAVGIVQTRRLPELLAKRRALAAHYDKCLHGVAGVKPLPVVAGAEPSYWIYSALLDDSSDRARLATVLRARYGVEIAWLYDPPCHLQPVFQDYCGTGPGDLPDSERILARHIVLPMHTELSLDDVEYVVASLDAALKTEL